MREEVERLVGRVTGHHDEEDVHTLPGLGPVGITPVTKPVVQGFVTNDAKAFTLTVQTGRTLLTTQGTFNELSTASEKKLVAAWQAFQAALVQFASDQIAFMPAATPEPVPATLREPEL